MFKPVTLPCGHSGCRTCMERVVVAVGEGARPKCPVCRAEMPRQLATNICLDQLTKKLAMQCNNEGCLWTGTQEGAEGHSIGCSKQEVTCQNEGCYEVMKREQITGHNDTCPKFRAACIKCNKAINREEMPLHEAEKCAFVTKECPLGCGERFPRCHVHIHLRRCQSKVMACDVAGCKATKRKSEDALHHVNAAGSHQRLQKAEIQRLRRLLVEKKPQEEAISKKEASITSFRWEIPQFKRMIVDHRENPDNYQPLSSNIFSAVDGCRWRAFLHHKEAYGIYLQLVSAVNPVMTELRIVLMSGEEREEIMCQSSVTMAEGENFGRKSINLERFLNKDGNLVMKFIITTFSLV